MGFDVSVLVRQLDLEIASVYDPDARVPSERLLEIWQRAEMLTKDPCIALRAACAPRCHLLRYARTEMQYLLVHLLASSPTLGEGLGRFARNFALLHIGAGEPGRWRLPAEFQVSMLVRLVMGLAGVVPTEVRFAHGPPAAVADYSDAFGSAVRFSAEDSGFVLSDAALAQVPPTANAELALALSRRAADALDGLTPPQSLSSQVRAEIVEALQRGCASAERVGRALGMSVRTLSRRLRHEGSSYQAPLDEVRAERARHYLEVAGLPAAEVGARLGLSSITCTNSRFNVDPYPGHAKTCQYIKMPVTATTVGTWQSKVSCQGCYGSTYSITWGTSYSSSTTNTEEWSTTVTNSVEAGMSIAGASGSVSSEYSSQYAQTTQFEVETQTSYGQTTTVACGPTDSSHEIHLYQFVTETEAACMTSATCSGTTYTMNTLCVVDPGPGYTGPKCLPGYCAPSDPTCSTCTY